MVNRIILSLFSSIRLAAGNLVKNKKRSFFSALSLGLTAVAMSFTLSFIAGLQHNLEEKLIHYQSGEIFIDTPEQGRLKSFEALAFTIDYPKAKETLNRLIAEGSPRSRSRYPDLTSTRGWPRSRGILPRSRRSSGSSGGIWNWKTR